MRWAPATKAADTVLIEALRAVGLILGSLPTTALQRAAPYVPGYQTKQESIAIVGVDDLIIRSLLDKQQYADPFGEAERLGISSAFWPLFGLPWPSGAKLAAHLAARPVNRHERILEIGCGLALASLVGHRRGANITASDCHPLTAAFLTENLRLNGLGPMAYCVGHWGAPVDPVLRVDPEVRIDREVQVDPEVLVLPEVLIDPARQIDLAVPIDHLLPRVVTGLFDLIIGSDVLYERDDDSTLAAFICRHASIHAEVWIVDPDRGNRAAFNRQMALLGFVLTECRLDTTASATGLAYKGRLLTYVR